MIKRGKAYLAKQKKIKKKLYKIEEAIILVIDHLAKKNKESIDIAMNLNVDTRHADQQLRGTINLPFCDFKKEKVLVFSDNVDKDKFLTLGATYVGKTEYLEKFSKNWTNVDVILAHPSDMKDIAKYGRLLGPKGLMPNPKLGTVSTDLEVALKQIVKGRIEYRTDKGGILHVQIGNTNMKKEELVSNFENFLFNIKKKKPSSIKGDFIKSIYLSSTHSPSIQIQFK